MLTVTVTSFASNQARAGEAETEFAVVVTVSIANYLVRKNQE